MKKQLLTLLITTIAWCSYGQWINQNVPLPYNGYINSLQLVDANIVWGNPWNAAATSPYTRDFVRTIDGGNTWTLGTISSAPSTYNVSNVWPLSADTAFASMWASPGGGVFRTTDGGTTWSQVGTNMYNSPSSFANFVYFWDSMNGITGGDPIGSPLKYELWLTSDGGNTWTAVNPANLPSLTNSGEYGITNLFDAVQGYFWFGTTYGDIYRSTDMGMTWTKSATGLPPYNNNGRFDITDFAFSDSLNGLVVQVNATGYVLMRTTDGGLTWNQITPLGTFYPTEIEGIPGTNYFVSGASNATYGFGSSISYDGGLTWSDLDMNASHTSFSFLDPNTGYGGEFINAGSPGGAWKYIGTIACGSILINSGSVSVNDSTVCFNDTLEITVSNAFPPTVGTAHGSALIISTGDISGSSDPLNQPGILGGTGVFPGNPPLITLINNASIFPAGTYYVTPVVFGNATGSGNITAYTLDPTCTYTGNSVMVTLLPQGDPSCVVGIAENANQPFSLSSYFNANNMLNVNIISNVNEKANLEIYDVAGRIIHSENIQLIHGNNQHLVNVKDLSQGAYFINLQTGNHKSVNKIVKF